MRVGLTGGIGSGKSEVSRRLAAFGAVVVDADVLAREVVARGTDGLAAVVELFGPGILTAEGDLDRTALAARVFADPGQRRRLEQIVHPRVRARAAEIEAAAGPGAIVVHDIPLLVETSQADTFDVVVVVDVPADIQVRRLVQGRQMTEEEARARIDAQASRAERAAVADHVIDNSGGLSDLDAAVRELWEHLRRT